MPDPGVPLNCPRCGERLVYQTTHAETHIYSCPNDGYMVLSPDGRVSRETPTETAERIGDFEDLTLTLEG